MRDLDFAMLTAARESRIETIRFLARLGANNFVWAMSCADGPRKDEVIEMCLKLHGTYINEELLKASRENNLSIVKSLIAQGATVINKANEIAAEKGYLDIVMLVLKDPRAEAMPPLLASIRHGQIHIVRYLLENYDEELTFAIYVALHHNQLQIMELLFEKAKPNLDVMLAFAEKHANPETIRWLRDRGAKEISSTNDIVCQKWLLSGKSN